MGQDAWAKVQAGLTSIAEVAPLLLQAELEGAICRACGAPVRARFNACTACGACLRLRCACGARLDDGQKAQLSRINQQLATLLHRRSRPAGMSQMPVMEPYARHVIVCVGAYCSPDRPGHPRHALKLLEERLRWLSAWTIHHANHIRPSPDGLKVGGHQASCTSMTAIMAALYFHALGPNDRVAVKPHAGPVLHAIHYLLGSQSRDQLENFRGFGGMQSYPSRTKDKIPVDFSTGSVGLGAVAPLFAALAHRYAEGHFGDVTSNRFIALMGDAELDCLW